MSSSNLLRGFGKGANVQQQTATDKALRRKATGNVRGFQLGDGQIFRGVTTKDIGGDFLAVLKHNLRRVPTGVMEVQSGQNQTWWVKSMTATEVTLQSSAAISGLNVWIV